MATYSVLVGNIGWVMQDNPNKTEALNKYDTYVDISRTIKGHRAYREEVTLWELKDGQEEPIQEYHPMDDYEFPSVDSSEKIVAVRIQDIREDTEQFFCYDCEIKRYIPTPESQSDYLGVAEEFQHHIMIAHTFLTEKYDELWSENGDVFLGKICESCHCTLGGWHVCKFCDGVEFPGDTHTCYEFTLAADAPEDSEEYQLYDDVMNGLDDGWKEDGFIEHVL